MTPEHLATVVDRWVGRYTRDLPASVAGRRREEVRADLRDHLEHARASGVSEAQLRREIAGRMVRGLLADTAWRRQHRTRLSRPEDTVPRRRILARPAARVLLGIAVVLAFPAIATPTGAADWGPGDFVLAAVLLAVIGTTLELAVRSAGNVLGAVAIAALGVVAAVAGGADDAPGLTLIGLLLVASAGLLVVRITSRAR